MAKLSNRLKIAMIHAMVREVNYSSPALDELDAIDAAVALVDAVLHFGEPAPVHTLEPIVSELAVLKGGHKIEAIKRYRSRTGLGLREAKEAIEAAQNRLGLIADSPPQSVTAPLDDDDRNNWSA